MNEIEFFKNNKKQKLDSKSIKFLKEEIKVVRETEDIIIILDFIKKECQFTLKKENITLNINVIEMSVMKKNNTTILTYILESEPEVKNIIKVKNEDT